MKLIRNGIIAASLAVALLTLAPARLQAQVPAKITFALTATYQAPAPAPTGPDQNIQKNSTKTYKLTSTSLVSILGLPAKSYFTLDIGGGNSFAVGAVSAVDPTGAITDESSVVDVTLGSFVFTGSADSDKGSFNATYSALMTVMITDSNGNSGTMSGLVKITDTIPALTAAQTAAGDSAGESVSFSGSLTGSGTVDPNDDGSAYTAVFTGTISGSGKVSASSGS